MFRLNSIHRFPLSRSLLAAVLLGLAGHLSAQTPAPRDGDGDIRGPKAPVAIPQPEKPSYVLWAGIGGAVLALAAATLLWRGYSRRQRFRSPPETALTALTELERSRETITAETFANRAAQTVRQYIADRFGLAAPRRTTEEFLNDMVKEASLAGESDHLRVFLKSCDMAKFAGSRLDAEQRGDLLQAARDFIRTTAAPLANSKSKAATP